MEVYGVIYLVSNRVNAKVYVGQTKQTIDQRWKDHLRKAKRGSKSYFSNAIRLYGESAFTITILEQCLDKNLLNEAEKKWISTFNSNDRDYGYNLTSGGQSDYDITPELRLRLSESVKRFFADHPEVMRMNIASLQKFHAEHPEARQEHSRRMKSYFAEHPEVGKEHSEKLKKLNKEHPEINVIAGIRRVRFYENHPEARSKAAEKPKYNLRNQRRAKVHLNERRDIFLIQTNENWHLSAKSDL